ncbi:MAG: hypothetical protein WDN24_21180 [Sphingomonas sp.]
MPKQIVLDAFGQCLVKQSPRLAARLLETPFSTKAEHDQAMTLAKANDACLRGRPVLSMQVGAIRGAVAEYALVSDEKLLDAARALPAAAPERPPIADGRAFVIAYATCIAHADPAHTVALIETPVASAEERSAFIGYGDTLKACMRWARNIRPTSPTFATTLPRRFTWLPGPGAGA